LIYIWNNEKKALLMMENSFAATVYLDKFIQSGWLYQSHLVFIPNPVSFVSAYIETGETSGYEVEESLDAVFRHKNVLSDAEIICLLSGNITLKNRRDSITLLKINTDNFVATKEEYESLCALVRKKYNIIKINPISLDDFVYEASMAFFRKFVPGKTLQGIRISEIAYVAESDKQFMQAMTRLTGELSEPFVKKQVVFEKDGYVATLSGTLQKPHIIISSLSFNMVLQGHKSSTLATYLLFQLKEESFWKEARYEFARKHEENLVFKKKLIQKTANKLEVSAKCSEKYHMTLGEIQMELKEKYGIEVTESAIGLTVKKALKKIQNKFEKLGINESDYDILTACSPLA